MNKITKKKPKAIRLHYAIFQDYRRLTKDIKDKYPTIAPYVSISYYYDKLARI